MTENGQVQVETPMTYQPYPGYPTEPVGPVAMPEVRGPAAVTPQEPAQAPVTTLAVPEPDPAPEDVEDAFDGAYMTFGEGDDEVRFKAAKFAPEWRFFPLASAMKKGDNFGSMAAVYDLVMALVLEDERERLNDFLAEHHEHAQLEALLDTVMETAKKITGRSFGGSSGSSTSTSTPKQK